LSVGFRSSAKGVSAIYVLPFKDVINYGSYVDEISNFELRKDYGPPLLYHLMVEAISLGRETPGS